MLTKSTRIAVLGVAILSLALAGAATAQEAPLKIAVIDLDRLVGQSAAGQALQNQLEAFQKEVQAEGQRLADKARATEKLLQDGANSLSAERLGELRDQYEDEGTQVRRYTERKQREGVAMRDEGLKKIEEKLQPVLDSIQGAGNYDLILNRALGVVVMASERVDITGEVLVAFDAVENAGNTAAPSDG